MSNINPRVDIAFKKIFGVEENKDLLMSLINSIVRERDRVVEITLMNPYNPKNFQNDKLSILDIKAKNKDGVRFNIEMQITDEDDYDKRALYYWAKLYTEQLESAQDYSALSKTIGIHILNFTSIPDSQKYHNVFTPLELDTNISYFADFELHTIELSKFAQNLDPEMLDFVHKIKTSLDAWAAFLTRHDLLEQNKFSGQMPDVGLQKALGVLEVMKFTQEERNSYEDHLKWLRIEANTLKKYEKKAHEKGLEEGRLEGRLEEKVESANRLLALNIHEEIVAQGTGLGLEEIKRLKILIKQK